MDRALKNWCLFLALGTKCKGQYLKENSILSVCNFEKKIVVFKIISQTTKHVFKSFFYVFSQSG